MKLNFHVKDEAGNEAVLGDTDSVVMWCFGRSGLTITPIVALRKEPSPWSNRQSALVEIGPVKG